MYDIYIYINYGVSRGVDLIVMYLKWTVSALYKRKTHIFPYNLTGVVKQKISKTKEKNTKKEKEEAKQISQARNKQNISWQ